MLGFRNVKVYNLKESVIACRNAFRTEIAPQTDEEFEGSIRRAKMLAMSKSGSGHTSWRKGILVSFDMRYTQYITKQLQRYHWLEYICSSSMMHRLTAMDVDGNCAKYVDRDVVENLQLHIDKYNRYKDEHTDHAVFKLRDGSVIEADSHNDVMYYQYMICIQNCPMGYELFVHVTTNYEQLATIYAQRKGHRLREDWEAFMDMVKSLPYSREFITGGDDAYCEEDHVL